MQGSLTDELRTRIRNDIKSALSSRHIPAKMINIHKIPYTTNGKRLEVSESRDFTLYWMR